MHLNHWLEEAGQEGQGNHPGSTSDISPLDDVIMIRMQSMDISSDIPTHQTTPSRTLSLMDGIRAWGQRLLLTIRAPSKERATTSDSSPNSSSTPYQSVNQNEEALMSSQQGGQEATTPTWSWLKFVSFCGSGLMMSVSYLDPGNLEADIQVGVVAGYGLLWWSVKDSKGIPREVFPSP
jgi:hypothetical protein